MPTTLSTGHVIQVRKVGTRVGYPAHTLHIVDFFESQQAFEAGGPFHREEFETQWNAPHPDPGSRMLRIFERYVEHMSGGKLLACNQWSDAPDTHGNLAHPSMEPFKANQHATGNSQ